ncbi:MAG: hypothetical protein LLG44_08635 [Chloroflexi bacterium]|nr:hypothetical protein [Chloroflexota bacterium]
MATWPSGHSDDGHRDRIRLYADCHAGCNDPRGPNSLGLEWHWLERPHWEELVRAGLLLIEDDFNLSDARGLGAELDETAAERYLCSGAHLSA